MASGDLFMGVDAAFRRSGVAVVDSDGDLVGSGFLVVRNTDDVGEMMVLVQKYLTNEFFLRPQIGKIRMMGIERDSVPRNMDTIRKICYSEAAFIYWAADHGVKRIQFSPQRARKLALDLGGAKKDEVVAAVRKRFPDHDLSDDECDAVVLALAAREHATLSAT